MVVLTTSSSTREALCVLSANKWENIECLNYYMGKEIDPFSSAVFSDGPRIQFGDKIYYFWSEEYKIGDGYIVALEVRYHLIGGSVRSLEGIVSQISEIRSMLEGGVVFKKVLCSGFPYPTADDAEEVVFDYGFLIEHENTSLLVWSEAPGTVGWTLSKELINQHLISTLSVEEVKC